MRTIRLWHSYIGLFVGPSVLFFSLTGAAQLFGLHEAHGSYTPPAFAEKLSSVHKDQVFALGDHPAPSAADAAPPRSDAEEDHDRPKVPTLILKVYFLLVALSLAVSTVFGMWMGLTQTRHKRLARVLIAAGTLIPIAVLLLAG